LRGQNEHEQEEGPTMTVVSLTAIRPKPGASWDDIQKSLKEGNDLVRKHGGENVTTMVTMAAGEATGSVTLLYTAADWTSYGKVQDSLMGDPAMQTLMADPNSPTAGWSTYLSQTIPDL
jgi:hypothetical protein